MSASREKKERKNSVLEPKQETKKGMSSSLKSALIIAAIVIVVALIVFLNMMSTGFFANHSTAVVTGSHKLSPAMVNYYFADVQANMQNTYGDMYSYIIDSEKPLSEQVYNEEDGTSWADYFMDEAVKKASQTYAIYDAAVKEGCTLKDEDQQQITSVLENFKTYGQMYGFANANGYIAASYGTGCNEKNFREYMEVTLLVSNYCAEHQDALTFSDDDINAEYSENANDYDTVTYRKFAFYYSDYTEQPEEGEEAEQPEVTDEIKAQVKELAEAMVSDCRGKDAQTFFDACVENSAENTKAYYEDNADYNLRENYSYSSCEAEAAEWLFGDRSEGDVEVFESESGYTVCYFESRNTNDTKLVNVRHILVNVDDINDEVKMLGAKETAEDLLAQYQAGEQTEEAFAELAKNNSGDSNAAEGGLYENVYPGQMVSHFNDWCFDESRKSGDVGIVETEYGYHVIYFVSQSEQTYRNYLVEKTLKDNAYTEWETGLTENASYTFNKDAMKYTSSK